MYRLLALPILCLGPAGPLHARDLYVSNVRGDDQFDGRAPTSGVEERGPVRTIGRALRLVRRGDRVIVEKTDRPYREVVSLSGANHSGTAARPFVLEGNGATISGVREIPSVAWQRAGGELFWIGPRATAAAGLFLDGKPAVRRDLDRTEGGPQTLDPGEWMRIDGRVYFRVESGKLPRDYALTQAGLPTGITLYHVRHVVVSNFVVEGFAIDGVSVADGVRAARLEGIDARHNGRAGITVAGSSRVGLVGCRLAANGLAQFRIAGPSLAVLRDCELDDQTAPDVQRLGGDLTIDGQAFEAPTADGN